MQEYLLLSSIQWLLIALFLTAFEILRWRSVPNMLPHHKANVPVYINFAMLVFYGCTLFSAGSIWWFNGFFAALVALGIAWGVTFVIGGIVVPFVFRGDNWFPFTLASLAIWPVSFFFAEKCIAVFWTN